MDARFDIETYPELRTWTLINLMSNEEHIVTEAMLVEAFPDETTRMTIMANRSNAWQIFEN